MPKNITIVLDDGGPESIENLIEQLIQLHRDWDSKASAGIPTTSGLEQMQTLAARLLNWVIWNPGAPIRF